MPTKIQMQVEVVVQGGLDIRDKDTAGYTADFVGSVLRMQGFQNVNVKVSEYAREVK